jgi:DNA end-binding protein Ku
VRPCGRGLIMEVLRYADEVAKVQNSFKDLPKNEPNAELIDLATTLIEKKTGPFKPETFRDHYIDALHRLIEKKRKAKGGKRILEDADDQAGAKGGNIVDLMAALKKSVGGAKPPAKPRKAPSRRKRA